MKKIIACLFLVFWAAYVSDAPSAPKKAASAIVTNSKVGVRAKVDGSEKYNDECYEAYFGCMDQFCISDNESGGSCICSSSYNQYDAKLKQVEKNTDEANRRSTIEIEKIKAGANADILFTGTREYDKDGNVATIDNQKATKKRARQASIEEMMGGGDDEEEEETEFSMEGLTGKSLYDGARNICLEQVGDVCGSTLAMQTQRYLTQIKNDCTALSKSLDDLLKKSELAILDADKEMVAARAEVNKEVNKYNRGQCMVEFKKCMMTGDACGPDWGRCASSVAAENMQNNAAVSTRGTKVGHTDKFDITDSTREMLESKRNICEGVLDQCQSVRGEVWTDFLRDVAPEMKIAEANLESGKRQSCLADITGCIQKACKDDIAGKGQETMDSCLARPEMARSFCKIEIDPCERMEPQIWDYVVSKLAAMRVDACTNEVKECFTSDDRCGSDFSKCIGMDYKYLHDMCPVDKLVVCKQANKNFQMSDIDGMLMGFFLNVDNSALELCQNKIDAKMEELCGSTLDCNRFAADDTIGTGSLKYAKKGNIYSITGMLSFGLLNVGDGERCDTLPEGEKCTPKNRLKPGEVGVRGYLSWLRENNQGIEENEAIIGNIEAELLNISGKINQTVEMIESDQEIKYCVEGRDLSQINGRKGANNKTTARFPNLLNNTKQLIASSALRQAQDNYNREYKKNVAKAFKEANADVKQYMCQKVAAGEGGGGSSADEKISDPWAIRYDVSAGLSLADLLKGGSGTSGSLGGGASSEGISAGVVGAVGANISITKADGGATTTINALFNRETGNCHICKQITKKECSAKGSVTVLFVHVGGGSDCKVNVGPEKCEDVAL